MLFAPEPVIAPLIAMPLSALRYSVLLLFHEIESATVIAPPSGPSVPVAVVTVTFPRPSCVCKSPVSKMDELGPPPNVKLGEVPLKTTSVVPAAWIEISFGSSSSVPATPCGARMSAHPLKSR